MVGLEYWRLSDQLTVKQAAALIVGVDPGAIGFGRSGEVFFAANPETPVAGPPVATPREFNAVFEALRTAVLSGSLEVTVMRDAWQRLLGEAKEDEEPLADSIEVLEIDRGLDVRVRAMRLNPSGPSRQQLLEPDWSRTIVKVEVLKKWLRAKNLAPAFFFHEDSSVPDYLNPKHPRYSSKLAAAVHAWIAVDEPKGQSPKKVLLDWLRKNWRSYEDLSFDGEANNAGIEECAKVANWKSSGGV